MQPNLICTITGNTFMMLLYEAIAPLATNSWGRTANAGSKRVVESFWTRPAKTHGKHWISNTKCKKTFHDPLRYPTLYKWLCHLGMNVS